MHERTLSEFRTRVRRALSETCTALPVGKIIEVTDLISEAGAVAVDREVEDIVRACGIVPDDELGGSFL